MAIVTFPTLFAVMADPDNRNIAGILEAEFPEDYIQIRPGQWFLVFSGTTRQVSDKLKETPGNEAGAAVIVSVNGYYGRTSSQVWEWVAAKVGKPTSV